MVLLPLLAPSRTPSPFRRTRWCDEARLACPPVQPVTLRTFVLYISFPAGPARLNIDWQESQAPYVEDDATN